MERWIAGGREDASRNRVADAGAKRIADALLVTSQLQFLCFFGVCECVCVYKREREPDREREIG